MRSKQKRIKDQKNAVNARTHKSPRKVKKAENETALQKEQREQGKK